ncbi:hypothetical protein DYB37_006533 [Aphanomyces astaci]|uniref:Uncharacterized protein n=1 Tax=Aphanomyces astaci TaxID=112090 RepID=A0A3R7EF69_APHAT|nr:hypothetical protein DYB35_002593 [Aphanomyces astaci]RHZ12680.1 hypothetical protein DYB37_006533 [Aphanomyces astaci]
MAEEAEFQVPPEPVAPWNWSNIPDYGPLKQYQHAAAFFIIGLTLTGVYEFTTYFDQIPRELAYPLIWVFIFLRMLGKLGPSEMSPEEELAHKEREDARQFKATLHRIATEKDDDDEDDGEGAASVDDDRQAKKTQ